jgi:hypothetical protein
MGEEESRRGKKGRKGREGEKTQQSMNRDRNKSLSVATIQ